ncbi:MAG TPA: glycosyltransferase family 39 protein [Thermoanaerobaculia bacterium]|nr:glycosyltransferase family 39 protein [Thermoanaerobaculia bacterium]
MERRERLLWAGSAAAALLFRALAFFRYRFDADEQHHAHVTWGWTDGLVQYRDYFDNHAPLFHMLLAPYLALFGETARILLWLRIPMLALFAVVVWATYVVARRLYDERVARWAALLLAFFPPFFLKSLEFRTDNLWNALWMLAVVALVSGKRPLILGLILGAAFAVSMKTTLLIATLLIAALIARAFLKVEIRVKWLEGVAGFLVVPALLAIYFMAVGAFDELLYCNFTFNGNLAKTRNNLWVGRAFFPFLFAGVVWLAWRFRASQQHAWRYFFAVAIGVYAVTLSGFWILISPRDFLPLMPLAAMFAAAVMTRMRKPVTAFASVVALCIVALWYYADRFANKTAWHTTMMEQALRLSHPGEPVIDLKGETIFRRRPFYYAFEYITRAQIAHGLIRDTVAADVVRTRTYVAQADGPMWPPAARAFLSENFINLGRLRAAGQRLREDGTFSVAIPGEYVLVSERGEARGVLDGVPYSGARVLGAGVHRFEGEKDVAFLWAPAFRRGHSPFKLRDLEF